MVRHGYSRTIGGADWAWYAAVPAVGYGGMLGAGVMVLAGSGAGCGVLGGGDGDPAAGGDPELVGHDGLGGDQERGVT